MRKSIILPCIIFFFWMQSLISFAQHSFFKTYNAPNNYREMTNAAGFSDSTYIALDNVDNGACSDDYRLLVLNKFGNTTGFIQQSGSTSRANYLEKAPFGSFYCIGRDTYCGDSAIIYVSKLSTSSSQFWLRTISLLTQYSEIGVMYGSDSSITVRYYNNWDMNQHFLKYSFSGNVISNRTYQFGNGNVIMLNSYDDNYFLAQNFIDSLNIRHVIFLKLNANLDSSASFSLASDSISYLMSMNKLMNGNILVIGWKTVQSNMLLAEVDTSGNFVWSKNYFWKGGNSITSLCQRKDSGLSFTIQNSPGLSYLLKCNHQGDSITSKNFSLSNDFTFRSIKETNDSGYIMAGMMYWYSKGFVLKTDSNGDTRTTSLGLNHMGELAPQLSIIPNPSSSFSTIVYSGIDTDAFLCIEDLRGQTFFYKQIEYPQEQFYFDSEKLRPGFYLCSILKSGRKTLTKKLLITE